MEIVNPGGVDPLNFWCDMQCLILCAAMCFSACLPDGPFPFLDAIGTTIGAATHLALGYATHT